MQAVRAVHYRIVFTSDPKMLRNEASIPLLVKV